MSATTETETETELCDLPDEMLSEIAKRLDYFDVLRFRLVCKRFLGATYTATAEIESTREPLFLVYGCGDGCYLVSKRGVWNRWSIPQLKGPGAICLASCMGWLLVFQTGTGSMVFIQPFCSYNMAIQIPIFPYKKLSSYCSAAFSSPPSSRDCIVVVVNRFDDNLLDLHVARHGCEYWITHRIPCPQTYFYNIKGSAYHDGIFYFFSPNGRGIRFCPKRLATQKFDMLSISKHNKELQYCPPFPFFEFRKNYATLVGLKKQLGLAENNRDTSITTCGTVMTSLHNHNNLVVIFNEVIRARSARGGRPTGMFQGVWIHPRYHTVRGLIHNQ